MRYYVNQQIIIDTEAAPFDLTRALATLKAGGMVSVPQPSHAVVLLERSGVARPEAVALVSTALNGGRHVIF